MEYVQLLIVAILVEAIWENIKCVYKNKKIQLNMVGPLVLSIIVCLCASIDIFPIIGVEMIVPFIGSVLTGIIISRGANILSDLIKRLKNIKEVF